MIFTLGFEFEYFLLWDLNLSIISRNKIYGSRSENM